MHDLTHAAPAPPLTEARRSDILEYEIGRYLPFGFQITSQTTTSAHLSKPRRFGGAAVAVSFLLMALGFLWLPFFGLGLLCLLGCLCSHAMTRDKHVQLRVDDDAVIHIQGDALADPTSYSGARGGQIRVKGHRPRVRYPEPR